MDQAFEVAKLMSVSDCAVPKHLRNNPGACLAVAIQGFEWAVNAFAIANKSYVVNDRLAYESALYHAVLLKRAPIKGRIRCDYVGEGEGRRCKVSAVLAEDGSTIEYLSPIYSKIQPKNSPLWKSDPDQQLFYSSVRAFARRHFPDVMMGIYTVDELIDTPPQTVRVESTPSRGSAADLNRSLDDRAASDVTTPISEPQTTGETLPDPVDARIAERVDTQTGEATPADDAQPSEEQIVQEQLRALFDQGEPVCIKAMTEPAREFAKGATEKVVRKAIAARGGKWTFDEFRVVWSLACAGKLNLLSGVFE